MLTVHHRLRPRPDWGVRVTPLTITVSRPTSGVIEVPWSAVTDVRRAGDKRDTVVLFVGGAFALRLVDPRALVAKASQREGTP